MFLKAFLVNVETKNIFYKQFDQEFVLDPTLLSSFLSGISLFARDMSNENDELKEIIMGKNRIYYHLVDRESDYTIILVTDKHSKEIKIKKLLNKFEISFFKSFSISEMKRHSSDPEYFHTFDSIAENIVNNISQSEIDETIEDFEEVQIGKKVEFPVKKETLQLLFKLKKNLAGVIRSLYL
ncbi:MAG: hypothetical protein EU551_04565, partial [Promethearchaeota archaeon]